MVTLVIAATALVAWWAAPTEANDIHTIIRGQRDSMGPARKLLQSPELTELLLVQARNVDLDSQMLSEEYLRKGMRKLMDDFGSLVDDHLDENSRHALESARIDPAMFTHLRKMFYTIRDPRVLELGRHAFMVLSNASATPQDVQRLLKGNLGMNDTEVANLQADAVPHEILAALRARRGNIELGFSPAAVDHLRRPGQSREHAEWALRVRDLMPDFEARKGLQGASPSLRRLESTAASLTVGIVTVGVDALVECFVQLQIFADGFQMPAWLWTLVAGSWVGLGAWGCGMNGLWGSQEAIMCDVFLGSVGLNLLEFAIFAPGQLR